MNNIKIGKGSALSVVKVVRKSFWHTPNDTRKDYQGNTISIPFSVICSPIHIKRIVPVVMVKIPSGTKKL